MLDYTLTGVSEPVAATRLPSARSLLLHLARVAAEQPPIPRHPASNTGYVLTNEWYMSTAVAGGTSTSVVIPQVDQTWTGPHGIARQISRRGRPLVGEVGSLRTARAAEYGPVIREDTFQTADQLGPLAGELSTNTGRLRSELLHAAPAYTFPHWSVSYYLIKTVTDLQHQLVSPRLEASLWQVLAAQRDMRYLGVVRDRDGRVGDAVSTDAGGKGNERLVLIISPSTGHLLGEEDIFMTNPGALNIRTFPAVVSYVSYMAWGWASNMKTPAS